MKNHFIISLMSFVLLFFCVPTVLQALNDDPPVGIEIRPGHDTGDGPRGIIQSPITGVVFYDSIILIFQQDLGIINVTVESSSAGVVIQTNVNGSEPFAYITFYWEPGDYTITFVTENNSVFFGYFCI